MNIKLFSDTYDVRRLTERDVPAIYALCVKNEQFYRYCPPLVTEDNIRADMKALPPKKTYDDKYYFGYFSGDNLIAVTDLIITYPNESSAFIGFFMMEKSLQGHGAGTHIITELCAALKAEGVKRVLLGWVRDNPQAEHFWHKNGFSETGDEWNMNGIIITIAERTLE